MNIIKLDAIDSTNLYLKKLSVENELNDYTVVLAGQQTAGRGQMGTHWVSEPFKNLTFSVFLNINKLQKEQQFLISIAVSLAIVKALKIFGIPNLKIKWPNDILSANLKLCGILIENVIKANKLFATVIGIGLNVNQTDFGNLPKASSMRLINGKTYNTDEILYVIIDQIKKQILDIEENLHDQLFRTYENHLFRKDKPSTFKSPDGSLFTGYIKGVTSSGKLFVLIENNILKEYDLKEIELLY